MSLLSKIRLLSTRPSYAARFYSSNMPDIPHKIEVITQEDKKSWYQRPFRSYFRMAGFTFGLCMGTNIITGFIDDDRREFLTTCPDLFMWAVFTKSCYFGIIWPSFYIKALVKPKDVFYLGGSIN